MRVGRLDLHASAATVAAMASDIALEHFYAYGWRGRNMMAVRSPFAMDGAARELIGQNVRIDGVNYEILAVSRQISGPIAAGEPIGVEVRGLDLARPAA